MARTSDLSFRGAKRRGNLAVLGRIIGYFRRKRNCLPEIATSACGLLAMTYQGSMAPGTVHCTELAVRLPLRGRAWLSPPLQRAIDIQNFALSDQSHLEGHVIRCSDDEGVYIVGCQMPEDNYAIRNYVDSLLGQ